MLQESINLVALVAIALFASFIGKYLAQWVLQIYHHFRILDRGRYLAFYDKFRTRQAFDLLSKISSSLPDNYDDYLGLHRESRPLAYRLCLLNLFVLLMRVLVVVGVLTGGCFFIFGQSRSGWLYPLSVTATLLPAVYNLMHVGVGRGGNFYRLITIGVVLSGSHTSRK